MATMRAAWYETTGKPADVLVIGEMQRPEPAAGEVLVRVRASGINPSDIYRRMGTAPAPPSRVVPHQDGSGVIEAVGEGVLSSRVGERVWVYESTWNRSFGTAAEYTTVPAGHAVRLPDNASFAVGACMGVPAMTAHRAVFAAGPVQSKTVLVTGGAGSVGSLAVQLAKWGGATVIATVSSDEKAAVAKASGADHVVNYRAGNTTEAIEAIVGKNGVHHVADVDFGGNLRTSLDVLAPDGSIASYASRGDLEPKITFRELMVRNIAIYGILVYTMSEAAKEAAARDITTTLEAGVLKPEIAEVLPLDQIARAHERVEAWEPVGHLVLEIP